MLRANLLQTSKLTMVYPERQTQDGFWVSCAPYTVLAKTPPSSEVGQAILEALKLSRGLEPTPIDWKKRSASRLAAAGVKTEAAFQRGSKLVSIELKAGRIGFVAQHNGGTIGDTKGFTPIKGEVISLPELAGPSEVGSVALASLLQCTSEA